MPTASAAAASTAPARRGLRPALAAARLVRPAASAASPRVVNFIVPPCRLVGGSENALQGLSGLPPPVAGRGLLGHEAIADGAYVLDGDLDDVPGVHPDRWLPGEPDASRRAGRDDVTGREAGERGEELDGAEHVDEHLRGPGRLHDLAVERGADAQIADVVLVRGDHLGADRHAALEVLARRPLGRGALPVPGR